LADVSASSSSSSSVFTWAAAEAKLLRVYEEDVQALVRPDERADEGAVVVRDYSKRAAEDAFEVPDCLGVLHQRLVQGER